MITEAYVGACCEWKHEEEQRRFFASLKPDAQFCKNKLLQRYKKVWKSLHLFQIVCKIVLFVLTLRGILGYNIDLWNKYKLLLTRLVAFCGDGP